MMLVKILPMIEVLMYKIFLLYILYILKKNMTIAIFVSTLFTNIKSVCGSNNMVNVYYIGLIDLPAF